MSWRCAFPDGLHPLWGRCARIFLEEDKKKLVRRFKHGATFSRIACERKICGKISILEGDVAGRKIFGSSLFVLLNISCVCKNIAVVCEEDTGIC